MTNKLLKIALIGKTNAGKSTLINSLIGEKVSIINKKINTTKDLIIGILNVENTQLVFYDTPGSNILKTSDLSQKSLKINTWNAIEEVDYIIYIIDAYKFDLNLILLELNKINEANKPIILIFNKIDLINNKEILPHISKIDKLNLVSDFFNISAKYNKGLDQLLKNKSLNKKWLYDDQQITNKDDVFISNECTRNSLLKYLHEEIPYRLNVKNIIFKFIKKNELKIKQSIEITNLRYKSIILGKNGQTIKRIRESSQIEISDILKVKVHLYLQVNKIDE
jgi:GTP-binding protein Era